MLLGTVVRRMGRQISNVVMFCPGAMVNCLLVEHRLLFDRSADDEQPRRRIERRPLRSHDPVTAFHRLLSCVRRDGDQRGCNCPWLGVYAAAGVRCTMTFAHIHKCVEQGKLPRSRAELEEVSAALEKHRSILRTRAESAMAKAVRRLRGSAKRKRSARVCLGR